MIGYLYVLKVVASVLDHLRVYKFGGSNGGEYTFGGSNGGEDAPPICSQKECLIESVLKIQKHFLQKMLNDGARGTRALHC